MWRWSRFAAGLLAAACLISPVHAYAADEAVDVTEPIGTEDEVTPRTEGLIAAHSATCTAGTKRVYITAQTTGAEEMSEIGFLDVRVERSSDRTNWTTEVNLGDMIAEDTDFYSLTNYSVTVSGGYYYRVTLTHYAKEDTWFFPDKQKVVHTTSYVWVS